MSNPGRENQSSIGELICIFIFVHEKLFYRIYTIITHINEREKPSDIVGIKYKDIT